MFDLDKYSIKARLYPTFLVLLPLLAVSLYYITDFGKYYHYFTAFLSIGLFTFLLAQLGRDKGKAKEPHLYSGWGGKPSTQILRRTDNFLDTTTKNRYYELLIQKAPQIQIPTLVEEQQDPENADKVYNSCAKFVISKTRDTKKFNLLFKENINYGFRRNLWGMKSWALIILSFCFLLHAFFSTDKFSSVSKISSKEILLFGYIVVSTFFWLFIVTKNWIKPTAFAYSERLYESLNILD